MEPAIQNAIITENLEELKKLLTEISIDEPLDSGWTVLLHACNHGKDTMVDYLLKSGAAVNGGFELFTPLMAVCNSASLDSEKLVKCAAALIKRGADIDAMDKYKTTALMIACTKGNEILATLLLEAKCKVDKFDNDGSTALHYACLYNFPNIVKILLDHGASKKIKDRRGRLPIDIATSKGADNIIQMLDETNFMEEAKEVVYERKTTAFEGLITQLPSSSNSSGKDGFHNDVEILLSGMRLDQKANLFLKKNISLAKFLNLRDSELKELGLVLSCHREKVLTDNKRFFMHPWGVNSLPTENQRNRTWDIMDVVRSLANAVKQLHIMWATSLYCSERVTLPSDDNDPKLATFCKSLKYTYQQNNVLIEELRSILKNMEHLDKVDTVQQADYISPVSKSKSFSFKNIFFLGAFCAFMAWKYQCLRFFRK